MIKDIVTTIIFPPGLILVLLLGSMYWFDWKRSKSFYCLLAAFCLLYVLSIPAFGKIVGSALISQVEGPILTVEHRPELIVVLGGGMYYAGEVGWMPSNESFRRMQIALEIQDRLGTRTPVLVSGGKTHGARHPSEAEVITRYFTKSRAQITPILMENFSQNTFENAQRVATIVQQRNTRHMILVTSELHMPRALATFRARGMDPIPFPVVDLPRGPFELDDFLPGYHGIYRNTRVIYELVGILHYILTDKIHYRDLFYNV